MDMFLSNKIATEDTEDCCRLQDETLVTLLLLLLLLLLRLL